MEYNLGSCSHFLRDNATNIKRAISLLNTSSVPCFIHTLQLVIKDSLFEDDRMKLLLAKVRKLVCHFSHSSKASELLKQMQINLGHAQTKQNPLHLVQDVDIRWKLTYLMLERLKKLKLSVQHYEANYKDDPSSIITAEEWQLVEYIILLLQFFL